jgi:hypothetical protein
MSYGLQISENNLEISGYETVIDLAGDKEIEYNLFAVQLGFLFHPKTAPSLLTIDAGQMLQYNGKLDLQSDNEENRCVYLNNGNSILARELEEILQINPNGAIGATLGLGAFKFRAQYVYGFTNILNKLNGNEAQFGPHSGNTDFIGNQAMINLVALITF